MYKRLIALFLVLAMLVCVVPASVYAEDAGATTPDAGQTGGETGGDVEEDDAVASFLKSSLTTF